MLARVQPQALPFGADHEHGLGCELICASVRSPRRLCSALL
jgi:hypothetical protein